MKITNSRLHCQYLSSPTKRLFDIHSAKLLIDTVIMLPLVSEADNIEFGR
jgi:hypothetical protein